MSALLVCKSIVDGEPRLFMLVQTTDLLNQSEHPKDGLNRTILGSPTSMRTKSYVTDVSGSKRYLGASSISHVLGNNEVLLLDLPVHGVSHASYFNEVDLEETQDFFLTGFKGVERWIRCEK